MAKKKPRKSKGEAGARGGRKAERKSPVKTGNTADRSRESAPPDVTLAGPKHGADVFPIVGIGASAGGLAALKQFFSYVPADTGLAFVVVVHLSPEHKSHMPELLQPHIRMPVQQVTETMKLERNRVYVIPPNANLDTIDTHLRLTELEKHRQQRAPIDHFFRTLAKTHDGEAIGVVLTGTGSDGTLGLREIKEFGGLTIAQDPTEAEYDGMPQSAIATGMVDLVLPLKDMAKAILRFAHTAPKLEVPEDEDEPDGNARQLLQKIFGQLRARTSRDFSRYKRSTILRRIHRRMQLRHVEEVSGYLQILREQPDEGRMLADDLLITVTSFFRDREVFTALEKEVLPQLFEEKTAEDEIRVWTVGCATGEEAYSMAMMLYEEASRRESPPRLQVFASDLHEHSLKQAREGFYPGDIETDIPPERIKRFFIKEDSGYRIRKEIREMVIFAPHNLLSDPPFSRLDMISCRNLLIYIQREVQRDIIELFHYALRPEGVLVLGTSETLDSMELFRVQDKKHSIFRKRNVPGPEPRLPVFPMIPQRMPGEMHPPNRSGEQVAFGQLHQRLVEQASPPSALIAPDDRVVNLSNQAGRYLVHPGGELTANIYKLLRDELRIELRTLLHTVRKQRAPMRSNPVPVRFNGHSAAVVLHLRPAMDQAHEGYVLVAFEEQASSGHEAAAGEGVAKRPEGETSAAAREGELANELFLSRQRLQAIIEEYETSQEEMKAANEEMQSANEELRSTMEELETSKEELQSMNEELQTVNQENRHKVEELAQLSSDLQNLLSATDIATLFLDRDLRILRFTPKVSELFNVLLTDRGRPLSDLTHRLGYHELHDDAARVLDRLSPMEHEVEDETGHWFLTRIAPYRSTEDRIEGVVLTFVDITAQKQAEQEIRQAKQFAEHIIETLPEPLLLLGPDLLVKSGNAAFYAQFKVEPFEAVGKKVFDLGNGQWNIPGLRMLLENVLPEKNVVQGYLVEHKFQQLGDRAMLVNARQLSSLRLILVGIHDVTELQIAERARRISEQRLQKIFDIEGVGLLVFDAAGMLIDANDYFVKAFGYSREEIDAHLLHWRTMTPAEYVPESQRQIERLELTGRIGPYEKEYLRKDGSRAWMVFAGASLGDGTNAEFCIDITERKEAEAALRKSEEQLRTMAAELDDRVQERTRQLQQLTQALTSAAQRERQRLAEVLHDHVQQSLVAAQMQIDDVRDGLPDESVRNRLATIRETIDRTINTARSLAVELVPPLLHDQGVVAALEWLGRQVRETHGLVVEFDAEQGLQVEEKRLRDLLYQGARELLLNVVKHARTKQATLRLFRDDGMVALEVSDKGTGFDATQTGNGGGTYGMFHLRERAVAIGGALLVESRPGKGTQVTIRIPRSDNE